MSTDNFSWWQTGVVYQIYPRSFKDSDGDGIGDLQGIINNLDYLKGRPDSLGIDAIWISPIYPSPMADFGYDVADYTDIHPLFGDLATFDRLLEEAHKRDLRVILDFVPNHTSDEHPWFLESRASRDNPRRDWYIWRDAKPDGTPPNNWASMFGGRAWTWDETTQQYYLHLFHYKQPDLNWHNPAVKVAMLDVLRFWLDRGVDGFRMDVVGFIMKKQSLPDNPVAPDADFVDHPTEWGHLIHEHDVDQPEVHGVIREMRQILEQYDGDRIAIGEIWAEPRSRWVEYYGQDNDGLHLPFNFDLLGQPWDVAKMRHSVEELEAALEPGMWPNYVLGSHDKPRLATRYGKDAVRTAAMLLLTLRGTPTLYMGDELGMVDGVIPRDKIQDPQGINLGYEVGRDPCRTPIQWSSEQYAGFSTTEPWLPVAEGYQQCNVKQESENPGSALALYRKLLQLRKETPALNRGAYQSIEVDEKDCFAYTRTYGDTNYLILLNFDGNTLKLDLSDSATEGQIVLSTELDRQDHVDLAALTLRPHEGLLIRLV